MNRYPWWKYTIIAIALIVGLLYTLPNFFGEAPAVQISSARSTVKINADTAQKIDAALAQAHIKPDYTQQEGNSVKVRFDSTDTQIKARDVLNRTLNQDPDYPDYIVALNLVSRSPQWLSQLHALPMYLGLDLRGGVHFLMQVDMKGALDKKLDAMGGDIRSLLRDKNIRYAGITRVNQGVDIAFRDPDTLKASRQLLSNQFPDVVLQDNLTLQPAGAGSNDAAPFKLSLQLTPQAIKNIQDQALKQNITTLHNRINALGVAEPVIQQQGADRIVVQLPGVLDTAKAKDILGRTATLEIRMVDDSTEALAAISGQNPVPFGSERYEARGERLPLIVKRQVILTGENLIDAQPGFDHEQRPAVHLTLNDRGARIFRDTTRDNVGKRMAILLFEKGKGEVITAPNINEEIPGGRVQISGHMTSEEANDTALLLRAGSLAAPMEIIEERTVGPSLGAENIKQGFNSVLYGFIGIAIFMCIYYMLFGLISTLALGVNLLLLIALLSMIQITLTLPGIAAIALALGMAIDSNVLINERVREELRNGRAPQSAIAAGYDRAWATILDSNVTTLIAGVALLIFGSGAVRGFAIVHCLGILTSMFSAVFFSRGLVNLWYGGRKKLKAVSIGQVWKKPSPDAANDSAQPNQT